VCVLVYVLMCVCQCMCLAVSLSGLIQITCTKGHLKADSFSGSRQGGGVGGVQLRCKELGGRSKNKMNNFGKQKPMISDGFSIISGHLVFGA